MLIPFEDKIIGLLIGAVVCAIFGFVVYKLVKKDGVKVAEVVNSLTDAQKKVMINASMTNCSLTKALICSEPKVGNSKTRFRVLFYNIYFPNSKKQFEPADVSVCTRQFEQSGLKVGDFVTLQLSPEDAKIIL